MIEVDVRGLSCPMPLVETKKALDSGPDNLTVLADSGTAKANVVAMLRDSGYDVTVDESAEGYSIKATRA
ncbi:MAG: sulfurtransferase TusA family protein [Actinobacteria bacterium]|nr:sulfurtransferase TusA family protein [Actinomycetota bacterium]MCL5887885.1 sulfurtransferase TusA family protein [Actinomycetota bacterium]